MSLEFSVEMNVVGKMPLHLLILFIFQAALAAVFCWFIGRVIAQEARPGAVRTARNVVLVAMLVIPVVIWYAFHKALPPDESWTRASMPALWVGVILLGAVIGLTWAMRSGKVNK